MGGAGLHAVPVVAALAALIVRHWLLATIDRSRCGHGWQMLTECIPWGCDAWPSPARWQRHTCSRKTALSRRACHALRKYPPCGRHPPAAYAVVIFDGAYIATESRSRLRMTE